MHNRQREVVVNSLHPSFMNLVKYNIEFSIPQSIRNEGQESMTIVWRKQVVRQSAQKCSASIHRRLCQEKKRYKNSYSIGHEHMVFSEKLKKHSIYYFVSRWTEVTKTMIHTFHQGELILPQKKNHPSYTEPQPLRYEKVLIKSNQ